MEKSALVRLGRRMVVAWFRKNLSGSVAIAPAVLVLALAMGRCRWLVRRLR